MVKTPKFTFKDAVQHPWVLIGFFLFNLSWTTIQFAKQKDAESSDNQKQRIARLLTTVDRLNKKIDQQDKDCKATVNAVTGQLIGTMQNTINYYVKRDSANKALTDRSMKIILDNANRKK